YVVVVRANYAEVETKALLLQKAVNEFVAAPTQAGLEQCRKKWLEVRTPYGQTEVYRFYEGPIEKDGIEGRINAWPLDESYIDATRGKPEGGIIQDLKAYPTLTKEILIAANEKDGETNISTGFHAIEFLLWGQDFSEKGPGARPYTDFVDGPEGIAKYADRRRQYLKAVTDLLIQDLQTVKSAWEPGQEQNYASDFLKIEHQKASLQKVLLGMGSLSGGELAGERMEVAYDSKDQEDEHSCFSDNTYADILNNMLGIQNVFLGRYGESKGPGIYDLLVAAGQEKLAETLKQQMGSSVQSIQAMPGPEKLSFDQMLLGDDQQPGRQRVRAAIQALRQ
ncbi:MAG: imelysin family protein, partial [Myxococcota bacterium]